jgi:hypothetical protein
MTNLRGAVLLLLVVSTASAAVSRGTRLSTREEFRTFVARHTGEEIFSPVCDSRVWKVLESYRNRQRLPNGARYGNSVRNYSLEGRAAAEIRQDMKRMGCVRRVDVLRNPANNLPISYQGRTLPLWVFLCRDGGFVRIKPKGDPTNLHRSGVHGNKGLRFPYNSDFRNFSDEIVKVDNAGNPVPKSIVDLGPKDLIDGWADDAHTNLVSVRR